MISGRKDREYKVLETLIRLFIEKREPISSRMIEDCPGIRIKSATIRSVLSELEKRGLLYQSHSCSGRVPTDKGYRQYVDGMLSTSQLNKSEEKEIQIALQEAGEDLEQLLRATARVLSRFSQNIAILAGPSQKSPEIVGVDLYQRDSTRMLVVISLDSGAVRTELVNLERRVLPESLVVASTLLLERLGGRTLEETRIKLDGFLKEMSGQADGIPMEIGRKARRLFDSDRMLHLTFEGVSEALEQPEFTHPDRLKALLALMSEADQFHRALDEFTSRKPGELSLAIGHENRLEALHPFSILGTRFEMADRYGYLAILGPQRMQYARTVSLVRLIMSHLDQFHF